MSSTTAVAADSAAAPAPAAAATGPSFNVYQYVVGGNSVLDALAIEAAVTPFLGEGKTLREVEAARAALEKTYHDAGYLTVVVTIPDQAVDSGEVALQVVEAVVDRLKVKGAEYSLPSVIKSGVPELAEGSVPNFNVLQAQLALVNRSADARVTPVLRAGSLPGTVEVQLDVDDQLPLHGSVDLSNRQTANTTAARLSASMRYDNLWQRGHSLGLTLQVAPARPSDARVAALTYVLPSGRGSDAWSSYWVHSRSDFASLSSAPGLGLLGNSDTVGLRYTAPLGANAEASQTLAGGIDYKNVQQTIKVADGSRSNTPIVYVPLVVSYNAALWGGQRSSALDLTLTVGLRGFLGNSDAEFQVKRSGAVANYLALRAGLQHSESFDRWVLAGRLDSQLATGPLVPNEQLVAGGAESVRGYLEAERSGDLGLRATLELRTPIYSPAGAASAWRLGGLAFIEAARLKTLQPVAPQRPEVSLAGTGFGLRLTAPRGLSLELDLARALVDGDSTRAGASRLHARAVWGY
ncbi:MAG: ShlB/FhaC/HecB family hemolysin secretion/activation protein [Microbacteriaceae bacterium]|nr:ShlB/FhaC/HecB family hemolysin secretion/activation protein [Burkholderiaceae bacterium]